MARWHGVFLALEVLVLLMLTLTHITTARMIPSDNLVKERRPSEPAHAPLNSYPENEQVVAQGTQAAAAPSAVGLEDEKNFIVYGGIGGFSGIGGYAGIGGAFPWLGGVGGIGKFGGIGGAAGIGGVAGVIPLGGIGASRLGGLGGAAGGLGGLGGGAGGLGGEAGRLGRIGGGAEGLGGGHVPGIGAIHPLP